MKKEIFLGVVVGLMGMSLTACCRKPKMAEAYVPGPTAAYNQPAASSQPAPATAPVKKKRVDYVKK